MRSPSKTVIAVLFADVHLSHLPPLARAGEPDWYAAMKRVLDEVWMVSVFHKGSCICAGDIFDKPDNPAELVNFACRHFPRGTLAIPGQHDLPYHRYADLQKSSYATLMEAGVVNNLTPGEPGGINLCPWGWPYGWPIEPRKLRGDIFNLAVVHQYVWIDEACYPNAPPSHHLCRIWRQLDGYNTAVFGDNHKRFSREYNNQTIYNCGTLMRRKADEIDYRPAVGLLHADGVVTPHYLSTEKDVINVVPHKLEQLVDSGDVHLGEFVEELKHLGDTELDFKEAMRRYLRHHGMSLAARKLLLEAMG